MRRSFQRELEAFIGMLVAALTLNYIGDWVIVKRSAGQGRLLGNQHSAERTSRAANNPAILPQGTGWTGSCRLPLRRERIVRRRPARPIEAAKSTAFINKAQTTEVS